MTEHRTQNAEHRRQSADKKSLGSGICVLCSEKGVALVMVLVLSGIALAIMTGLLYMLTAKTQFSGMNKRYKTALEAGKGGFSVTTRLIDLRGDPIDTPAFIGLFPGGTITTPDACSGTNMEGVDFTGLEAKFLVPTTSWASCNDSSAIDPAIPATYDMQFDAGADPFRYTVFAKVVDTLEGNTAPSSEWEKDDFPPKTDSPVYKMPYLYTVEIDAQNAVNPAERAKLSILYQY